jgi:hypothetical protein
MTYPSLQGLRFYIFVQNLELIYGLERTKRNMLLKRPKDKHGFFSYPMSCACKIICYIGHWRIIFLISFSDLGLLRGRIDLNARHVLVAV